MLKTERKSTWFACAIAAAVFLSWECLLFLKYFRLGYCDWDLAFFSQAMWGLLGGHAYSSVQEISLFGNHSNFIAFLVAPFYALMPHPLTLVTLKVLSYSLAGLILFHAGRPRIGGKLAIIVQILYYCYLPNACGQLHDFDFESLSPCFLAAMIFFVDTRRWRPFLVTAALAMLIKENMPLVVAAFGLYGLTFEKDKWRWGMLPLLLGAGTFIVLVKLVIPFMATGNFNGQHPYLYQYAGLWEHGPVKGLGYLKDALTRADNLIFFRDVFGPFIFVLLYACKTMLIISPVFLQHFLSSAGTQHVVWFYYVLPIAPFLFFALIQALERLNKILRPAFVAAVLVFCASYMLLQWKEFSPEISLLTHCQKSCVPQDDIRSKWRLVDMVPKDQAVVATFAFLAPLYRSPELYSFQRMFLSPGRTNGYDRVLPGAIKYALIDLDDRWLELYPSLSGSGRLKEVTRFLGGDDWTLIAAGGSAVLLKRGDGHGKR